MRWWIFLIVVLVVLVAIILLIWRESRLRSAAVRAPAHAKSPGQTPESTRAPTAERETVTPPAAKPGAPEPAPSPAATAAGEPVRETSATASPAPEATAGTTSTVAEPTQTQTPARPATSGGGPGNASAASGAFVADEPRTADTSRYSPPATSEWASGDAPVTGTPTAPEATAPDTARPDTAPAQADVTEPAQADVTEEDRSEDGDSHLGRDAEIAGAGLAGSAALAGGAALAHQGHESGAADVDDQGQSPSPENADHDENADRDEDGASVSGEAGGKPGLRDAEIHEPGVEADLQSGREGDGRAPEADTSPDASLMDVDVSSAATDKTDKTEDTAEDQGDGDSHAGRDAETAGAGLAAGAALAGGAALAHHERDGEESSAAGTEGDEQTRAGDGAPVAAAKDDWFTALGGKRPADAEAPGGDGDSHEGEREAQAAPVPAQLSADEHEVAGSVTEGASGQAAPAPGRDHDPDGAPDAMPYGPGSAAPLADGSAPAPGYTIKANPETMRYHTHESPDYERTRHQAWFSTEAAAATAGFRPWNHEERERTRQAAAAAATAPLSPYGSDSGFSHAATAEARPAGSHEEPESDSTTDTHDITGEATYMGDSEMTETGAAREAAAEVPAAGVAGAVPAPRDEVPDGPHGPGSAHPLKDGSAPHERFTIKGNADSGLYHGNESQGYEGTRAEVWFESEEHAEAAGYKAWNWRARERKARKAAKAGGPSAPAAPVAQAPAAPVASAAEAEAAPQATAVATVTEEARPETGVTTGGPDDDGDTDVASAVPAPRTDALPEGPEASGASGDGENNDDEPSEPEATVTETSTATDDTTVARHHDGIPHGPHGEGSAHPQEDGSSPHERFHVKGNDDSGLYHTSDSPSYGRTGAEVWFASNEHADAAGYTHWNHRKEDRADLVAEGPHGAGSARPLEDASTPHERFHVKGNDDSGLYHTSDSPSYGRTGAEVWFASEEHARAAGYKHWDRKKREAEAAAEIPEGPHGPGSAHPLEDGSSPHERFAIKGNADSGLFHTTESPYHGRTKAEVWFESEEHAKAAGYKPWNWRDSGGE